MAALHTRARIAAHGDFYLCPLSALQAPPEHYGGRSSGVRRDLTFTLTIEREELAITQAMSQLGWRVYATNHQASHLTLEQAVDAYRDEYLVERNFLRLKGHPLGLTPLYDPRDAQRAMSCSEQR